MKISAINQTHSFTAKEHNAIANDKKKQRLSVVDMFEQNIINTSDMSDTVSVPRTIFKGYLSFMAGTTLTSIGGVLDKSKGLSKTLNIAGLATMLYGTYSFVKPYLVKGDK